MRIANDKNKTMESERIANDFEKVVDKYMSDFENDKQIIARIVAMRATGPYLQRDDVNFSTKAIERWPIALDEIDRLKSEIGKYIADIDGLISDRDRISAELVGVTAGAVVATSKICELYKTIEAKDDELYRLKAALPATAEGVSIVPGMEIFYASQSGDALSYKIFSINAGGFRVISDGHEAIVQDRDYYSTRSVCEAAKEGK